MPRPRFVVPLLLGLAAVVPPAATPLAAQGAAAGEPGITWELGEGKGSWCVQFLVSPKDAEDLLVRGQRGVAAAAYADLPAPLRRVITDEPEYASWIPSQACLWFTAEVVANRRRYDAGDGGKPLALFWWSLIATGDRLGEQPGLSQVVLATNSSGLKRQMELEFLKMERIEISRTQVKDSDDEEFTYRLDRTIVALTGHSRPDSTRSPQPLAQRMVVRGDGNRVWTAEFAASPSTVGLLPGALRVQGKGDLSRALTSSPIRQIGPFSSGGFGTLRFFP